MPGLLDLWPSHTDDGDALICEISEFLRIQLVQVRGNVDLMMLGRLGLVEMASICDIGVSGRIGLAEGGRVSTVEVTRATANEESCSR